MENETTINKLRKEVEESKPEQVGKMEKIGKEDAIIEAEYLLRTALKQGKRSDNPMRDLGEIFAQSFQYLAKVGYGDVATKDMFLQKIKDDLSQTEG